MSSGPLEYQSAQFDALKPGEVIIWESPAAAKVDVFGSRMRLGAVIFAAIFVVLGSLFVPFRRGIATFLFSSGLIGGVCLFGRDFLHEYRRTHRRVRLTNQRAIILDSREAARSDVELRELWKIGLGIGRKRYQVNISGAEVEFSERANADRLFSSILKLIAQSGRRSGFRRSPPAIPAWGGLMEQTIEKESRLVPEEGLLLQEGEVVLWSGRPRVWEGLTRSWWRRRLRTLVWLIIWAGLIVASIYAFINRVRHGVILVVMGFAMLGLLVCLHSLFIEPFRTASRRKRTRYYLTNLRAVTVVQGAMATYSSIFLDMASGTVLDLHDDGTGDVQSGLWSQGFERIPDAKEVHRLLVDAIRATGGPLQPIPPSVEEGDDMPQSNQLRT